MRFGANLRLAPAEHRVAGALLIIIAASLAALIAHVGIDLAGDVLLVRDAYDGIGHDSRAVIAVIVILSSSATLLAWLAGAWREATGRPHAGALLATAMPRRALPFVIAVAGCGFVILLGMELADTLCAGRAVDDLGDLLGGSPALGAAVTALAAGAVALSMLGLGRLLSGSRAALIRVLTILLTAFVPLPENGCFNAAARPSLRLPIDVCARSGSLRAPPASAG